MDFQKGTIYQLFNEPPKKFIIPVYQRAYSWEEKQWETFLNDLLEQLEGQNNYFYGNILLEKIDISNSQKIEKFEIIDGQQRMTSFMLLLRAFYTKLETMDDNNQNVKGLRARLEPCI